MKEQVQAILSAFEVDRECGGVVPCSLGHIHDTYFSIGPDGARAYVVQRLNTSVFMDPIGLMENISRILAHLQRSWSSPGSPGENYRLPRLVLTRRGEPFYNDESGSCWRIFEYLSGTRSLQRVSSRDEASEAGRIFGTFLASMRDFPSPPLKDTLPALHNGPKRLSAFREACRADLFNRGKGVKKEIEKVLQREELARLGPGSDLPIRTVHNDAKITNVLFEVSSSRAASVIDLDTVMPGLAAFDFGDLVRTIPISSPEDGSGKEAVRIDLALFRALVEGYLAGSDGLLTAAERSSLVGGAKFITFLVGMRFLTDYLEGDHYFRTKDSDQNLRRSRMQLQILERLEKLEGTLEEIVDEGGSHSSIEG